MAPYKPVGRAYTRQQKERHERRQRRPPDERERWEVRVSISPRKSAKAKRQDPSLRYLNDEEDDA
jgi:hypothetical protein